MVKKVAIAILCCIGLGIYAQDGTVSPYSYFGIGESRFKGTVENQAMGGLGLYADSIHVNLKNPAAYGKLKLTTYALGASHREFRLKNFEEEQNSSVTNIDYLSVAFPISQKMGAGFGLVPYSSAGFNIEDSTAGTSGNQITNLYSGSGGLNKVYLSLGTELFKDMNIGGSINYYFGTLESQRVQSQENVLLGTLDSRESRMNGFNFDLGAIYTPRIKDKYTLHVSVRATTQNNLVSENTRRVGSFSTSNGQEIEVIDVDLDAINQRNTEFKVPTTTTLGLGFGEEKKWFLGAEYGIQQLSDIQTGFLTVDNVTYNDASSLAFGGYFIPDYSSFSGYFKRVVYRAGLRYDQTGIMVNGKEINNFGITFGMGLPLGNNFSNLNLGFELGRQGTTDAGLIEESYFKINVGLSFNDKWFQKRKIN